MNLKVDFIGFLRHLLSLLVSPEVVEGALEAVENVEDPLEGGEVIRDAHGCLIYDAAVSG